MGNKSGHYGRKKSASTDEQTVAEHPMNPMVKQVFNELSGGSNSIGRDKIETILGNHLTQKLWTYFRIDQPNSVLNISLDGFNELFKTLLDMPDNTLIRIFHPAEVILQVLFDSAGVTMADKDAEFVSSIVHSMTEKGSDPSAILEWKNSNCPRLFQPIRTKINGLFKLDRPKKVFVPPSDIITPVKMLILRLSLRESIYFPQSTLNASREASWNLLYSSARDGISTTAFEKHVFDFRAPTVSIFKLNTAEVFALAADEEWKQSSHGFGTFNSALLKLSPTFERFEFEPPPVFCNFKYRTSRLGIYFDNAFQVTDDNFSNLYSVEVWGCSNQETIDEQEKQKIRHKMQAEHGRKVPLPGQWDVEKSILEMGGFKFSSERRDDRRRSDNRR